MDPAVHEEAARFLYGPDDRDRLRFLLDSDDVDERVPQIIFFVQHRDLVRQFPLGLADGHDRLLDTEQIDRTVTVNPDALVEDLPVGVQQRVEIIKALYRKADILILDEPTAVLTPQEADGLFVIMRTLLERGVSIIFISHKLREVLEICAEIAVLRGGKVVGHANPGSATEELAVPDLEPVTLSEVGTKLDLARAYVDMGDPDGARNILNEVLSEGSASQKQEAQRLLESLPG